MARIEEDEIECSEPKFHLAGEATAFRNGLVICAHLRNLRFQLRFIG
jgi:hypothetical protein